MDTQSTYSIRKFKIGTASVAIGATLLIGLQATAVQAEEGNNDGMVLITDDWDTAPVSPSKPIAPAKPVEVSKPVVPANPVTPVAQP